LDGPVESITQTAHREAYTDAPTTQDLLGFQRFATPIAATIAAATPETTPLTIGVYGEWGAGKTSFLKNQLLNDG